MSQYTHTIFKSPTISFATTKDGCRMVIANRTIQKDTLILVEHAIMVPKEQLLGSNFDTKILRSIVQDSQHLFQTLYPRDHHYLWINPENVSQFPKYYHDLIIEKIQHNCFGHDQNIVLGDDISQFNTDVDPNCCHNIRTFCYEHLSQEFAIISVYALKDICDGQQLTIFYNTTRTYSDRVSLHDPSLHKDRFFNDPLITRIIQQYDQTDDMINVTLNQILAKMGLYVTDDKCPLITPRFAKNVLHIDINYTNLCDSVVESKVTAYKFSLLQSLRNHHIY